MSWPRTARSTLAALLTAVLVCGATVAATSPAAASSRATEGLLVLYDFAEGSGDVVRDLSGTGEPLDLTIEDPSRTVWTDGGLRILEPTVVRSSTSTAPLVDAITGSNELTLEIWFDRHGRDQTGRARIFDLANSFNDVSLALVQGPYSSAPDRLEAYIQNPATNRRAIPGVRTPRGSLPGDLTHVVVTMSPAGRSLVYQDGVRIASRDQAPIDGWVTPAVLSLGASASDVAPWRGEYRLLAVYDRALSQQEVEANFAAGPDLGEPPPVNEPPEAVVVASVTSGTAPLEVDLDGSGSTDADGEIVSYEWDLGDGTTATGPTVTHTYADPGSYTATLTVTDDDGNTDQVTFTFVFEGPTPQPPEIVEQPEDVVVVVGATATFTAVATGTPPLAYQWFRDGVAVPGATQATLTIDDVALADDGASFAVVVTGIGEPVTSEAAVLGVVDPAVSTDWWSNAHEIRIPVEVSPGGIDRVDDVATTLVDLRAAATAAGHPAATIDPDGLRLVEVDDEGNVVDPAVPFQFDPAPGFDPSGPGEGELILLLTGSTPAGSTRAYDLYVEVSGRELPPPPVLPHVELTTGELDEGASALLIDTPSGSWWYDEAGGGFSSLVDNDGADWISYSTASGSAGEFRGIPNLVYPEGHFHPGADTSTTEVLVDGVVRTSFRSTTGDGWQIRWDVEPTRAIATVEAAPREYWFLYEGTPGGASDPSEDTVTRSDGTTTPLSESWSSDLPGEEWVAFRDGASGRALVVARGEEDSAVDSYRLMNDEMTVFGFGRLGTDSFLTGTPRRFAVALVEPGDDFGVAARAAINPPTVSLGTVEVPVRAPGQPVAVAVPDVVAGTAPLTVAFDGSSSTDDGTIVSFDWAFGGGAVASGTTTTHDYDLPGTYVAELTVTDDDGNASVDHVAVVVAPEAPNEPPVAAIAADPVSGLAPLDASLSAAGSTDPDGEIVAYSWDLGDGTTASTPDVSHRYVDPGTYTATLTVTDDDGAEDTASVTIVASDPGSSGPVEWTRISSADGDLPGPPDQPHQTVGLTFDISGDGVDDIVLGGRRGSAGPSLVWYELTETGWVRRTIEPDLLRLEAGGAFADIDGDGDLDLVIGEDLRGNHVWWWENPAPDFGSRWTRREIKRSGSNKHHDQAFGDVDGDGDLELVFWNQGAGGKLFFAEIPANPTVQPWPFVEIFDGASSSEGLAIADIDLDGVDDIVGGGFWFRWESGTTFTANEIDSTMAYTRAAAAQFVAGGRPEVVFDSGDNVGPLRIYEWDGTRWVGETIIEVSDHGHSLDVGDVNRDGHVDLLSAEMALDGNDDAATRILYGDGAGGFEQQVVAVGIENHESKLADLDGDGDIDIMGKPFSTGAPGLDVWWNEAAPPPPLDEWSRKVADGSVPWRTIFVEHGDINGDGLEDVITGGWWWKNPGTVSGTWQRRTIGAPLNQMAAVYDFDGDGDLDVLGTEAEGSRPNANFRWAENDGTGSFTIRGNVEAGAGPFLQGVTVAELRPGVVEVALSWNDGRGGLQLLTVPAPGSITTEMWTLRQANPTVSGEGLDHGDIDGDGDLDLVDGRAWFRNDGGSDLARFEIHEDAGLPDRTRLVDMDGDGDLDAVVTYGDDDDGRIRWYEQGDDPKVLWTEHVIDDVSPAMAQSLDVADLDGDGDPDLVIGEHTNPDAGGMEAVVYENLGADRWTTHLIHRGDEHHDGTQLADFDRDGDLDVVSIGWTHRRLHVYENVGVSG